MASEQPETSFNPAGTGPEAAARLAAALETLMAELRPGSDAPEADDAEQVILVRYFRGHAAELAGRLERFRDLDVDLAHRAARLQDTSQAPGATREVATLQA